MAKKPDLDTQTKLSKSAGITQSTVWRVLEGQVGASIDVVERLAKAFGIPAVSLLSDADQSQLLECWHKLSAEDRTKVMAFMQVTISSRPSNIPASKTYWAEEQTIPASLSAAATRAGNRPPTRDSQQHAITTGKNTGQRSTS